jgi:HD-GYP domain-containing protein (c-di-GMP phosphodiesterase class II)
VEKRLEFRIYSLLERDLKEGNIERFLIRSCRFIKSCLNSGKVFIFLNSGNEEFLIDSRGKSYPQGIDSLFRERFLIRAFRSSKVTTSPKPLSLDGFPKQYAAASPLGGKNPLGAVVAFSRAGQPFSPVQKKTLKAISSLLSPLVSLGFSRKGEGGKSLPRFMLELAEGVISSPSIEDALSSILNVISSLYPDAFVAVRLREGNLLRIKARKGPPIWYSLQRDFQIGEGGAGHAALGRTPLFIPDVEADSRFIKFFPDTPGLVRSYLGIPLLYQDSLLGILDLNFPQKREITQDEISFLTISAHFAALALQALVSREEALSRHKELKETLLGTITSLSLAVEAKDSFTGSHIKELQDACRRIGSLLGLTSEELEDLQYASVLHDIGKVGIPDSVLRKPDKLTPEEWQIMKQHSIIGERIISSIPGLEKVSRYVRWHHERWDGKGYPDGLKGEEIPLPARILSVVDAYSAMREKRPYRGSLPQEIALRELRENAGTQFDPEVVEVFLSLFSPKKE